MTSKLRQLREVAQRNGVSYLRKVALLRKFDAMRTPTQNDPEVMNVVQAAAELLVSPRTVLHRIKAGKIAATKLGPGTSAYIISRAEVERCKAEGRAA